MPPYAGWVATRIPAGVAALLLAAWTLRRRARLSSKGQAGAAVAVVLLLAYAAGAAALLPDPEKLIAQVARTLGSWTYLLVGSLAFLETGAFVGFVIPGELTILVGGVVAAQGEISLAPVLGLAWLCSFLGDSTGFMVGRRAGRGFMLRHGPTFRITPDRLETVERYFAEHGGATVVLGRFIGVVRPLAPFIAGASDMTYARFAPYSILATGLWSSTYILLGYFFSRSFSRITQIAGQATLALGIVVAVVAGLVLLRRRLRTPEDRALAAEWMAGQGRRPLLRPFVPVATRAVLPAWRALAPGGAVLVRALRAVRTGATGAELVPLLATMAVGFYVFGLYAHLLEDGVGVTPLDRETLAVADGLRARWSLDLVRLLSDLGTFEVTATLVAATACFLVVRRRPLEMVALVGSFLVVWATVNAVKAGIDRPRPSASLVPTSNASFPSGHAALATSYVALGALLGRRLASRALLLLLAAAICVGVGLSRIYLRAHYWSDVAAGWGLGLAIFAAGAAVAVILLRRGQHARLDTD